VTKKQGRAILNRIKRATRGMKAAKTDAGFFMWMHRHALARVAWLEAGGSTSLVVK
jgi:hypothetical protein